MANLPNRGSRDPGTVVRGDWGVGPRSRTTQRRQTNVVPGAKRKPRLLCCAAKRWTCIDQIPHRICKVAFEEFHTEFARGHCARAASEFWPLPRPDFADRNA